MSISKLNKHKVSVILAKLECPNMIVNIKRRSSFETYNGYTGRTKLIQRITLCSYSRAIELEDKSRALFDLFDNLTQLEKDRVYNYEYIYIQISYLNVA